MDTPDASAPRTAPDEEWLLWATRLPAWKNLTQGKERIFTLGTPAHTALVVENGQAWFWGETLARLDGPNMRLLASAAPRPLCLHGWLPEDDPLVPALRAAGWEPYAEQTLYEAEITRLRVEKAQRLASHFWDGRRLPAGVEIVPLTASLRHAASLFFHALLPGADLPALERLRSGGAQGFSSRLSRVLLVKGVIRGAILCTWKGAVIDVDLIAVDSGLRRGWANLLLKQALHEPVMEMGVTHARFWVNPAFNADSLKAARLSGARIVARQQRWRLAA